MIAGKKFLLVVNDMAWFWSHRLPLAKDIMAQGFELHLATDGAADNEEIRALGIKGHNLPEHTGGFNPRHQLKLVFEIYKILRDEKPDIVHAITLRHAFFTGFASRLAKTPRAVFTIAGVGNLFGSADPKIRAVRLVIVPLLRFAFGGRGRFVIFQNPDDAAALTKAGAISNDKQIVIRGSGVDPAQFTPRPEPLVTEPVVLFPSRLLKAKGIGEYVHAARILKSKGVAARFLVAGDVWPGNPDSVGRQQMQEWADEAVVEWLGHRTDMPALMAGSHIVCLPSYYGEGVPKVLLEAAASGRAIVTADTPGCRETVEDGVTGVLVEPKNAWDLAAALEKLICNATLRRSMGEKGRERILTEFTVEKVNEKTVGVYRGLF